MKTTGSKQGFAWHVEQLRRAEGDPRRNKARCRHYDFRDGSCSVRSKICAGSGVCSFYVPITEEEYKKRQCRYRAYYQVHGAPKRGKQASSAGANGMDMNQKRRIVSRRKPERDKKEGPLIVPAKQVPKEKKPIENLPFSQEDCPVSVLHKTLGPGKILSIRGDYMNVQLGTQIKTFPLRGTLGKYLFFIKTED